MKRPLARRKCCPGEAAQTFQLNKVVLIVVVVVVLVVLVVLVVDFSAFVLVLPALFLVQITR